MPNHSKLLLDRYKAKYERQTNGTRSLFESSKVNNIAYVVSLYVVDLIGRIDTRSSRRRLADCNLWPEVVPMARTAPVAQRLRCDLSNIWDGIVSSMLHEFQTAAAVASRVCNVSFFLPRKGGSGIVEKGEQSLERVLYFL